MRLSLAPGGSQPTPGLTAAEVACDDLLPRDAVAEVRAGSGEHDIPAIAEEHLHPASPPGEEHEQRAAPPIAAELITHNRSAGVGNATEGAPRAGHHGRGDGTADPAERRKGHTQDDGGR
ncbi:hypothetical protein WMF38_31250 [Sorangium sp. So ce118]